MNYDENFHSISPIWKLSETLCLVDAALLICGIEPQGISQNVENWSDDNKPPQYLAARNAITSALMVDEIKGEHISEELEGYGGANQTGTDYSRSTVVTVALINWLEKRNYCDGYFVAEKKETADFLDSKHPRYSNKLAAVVCAWEAYDSESNETGTPKQKLAKWLRLNASQFNLTDEDGKVTEGVISELAKVANWAITGGAPKQPNLEDGTD